MMKKLRKNNGFAGIDISISMIIILIFIPTIFGIVYNVGKNNNELKRKANAVNIAVNVIEIIRLQNYENVNLEAEGYLYNDLKNAGFSEQNDGKTYSYETQDGTHYKIEIEINNHYPSDVDEANRKDLIKIVKVKVSYPVGENVKDIDISTVIKNS